LEDILIHERIRKPTDKRREDGNWIQAAYERIQWLLTVNPVIEE